MADTPSPVAFFKPYSDSELQEQAEPTFIEFHKVADDPQFPVRLSDQHKLDVASILNEHYKSLSAKDSRVSVDTIKQAYTTAVRSWIDLKTGESVTADILGTPKKSAMGMTPHLPGSGMVAGFKRFMADVIPHKVGQTLESSTGPSA